MHIRLATTEPEITACFPVMRELRPHLIDHEFPARIRNQQAVGYRLAFIEEGNTVVTVAGFRILENLAWGRFLYVDDLVTLPSHRSMGFGTRMLAWLRDFAVTEDCAQLHLDSGMHRTEAHRFYQREGLPVTGYHFAVNLIPEPGG